MTDQQTRPNMAESVSRPTLQRKPATQERLDPDFEAEIPDYVHLGAKMASHIKYLTINNDPFLLTRSVTNSWDEVVDFMSVRKASQNRQLARQAWELFKISESQVFNDVCRLGNFNMTRRRDIGPAGWPELDWNNMNPDQKAQALEDACTWWVTTFSTMYLLLKNSTFFEKQARFLQELDAIKEHLASKSYATGSSIATIFDFFAEFSLLVEHVAEVCRKPIGDASLDELYSRPSRYKIVLELNDTALRKTNVLEQIRKFIASTPKNDLTCTICNLDWAAVDFSIIIAASSTFPKDKWLSREDSHTLAEAKGCEKVPVKMKCGDLFCASCAKVWLKSPIDALECPKCNEDYGKQPSDILILMDGVGRDYMSCAGAPEDLADDGSD